VDWVTGGMSERRHFHSLGQVVYRWNSVVGGPAGKAGRREPGTVGWVLTDTSPRALGYQRSARNE